MTNHIAHVALVAIMANTLPAKAEEVQIDPLTQIMIETWEPTPQAALRLMAGAVMSEVTTEIDTRGLNAGVDSLRRDGCDAIFDVTPLDPLCDYRNGPGAEFYRDLWEYVTNGDFIKTVDQELLAQVMIAQVGIGRVEIHLKPLVPMIVQNYDPMMALDYQRWRENWCNFLFVPSSSYGELENRMGKPTREQCLEDPFAVYLTEMYCNGDSATCDLGHLSWYYGFLTRRYMWGGSEAVTAWQQAMYTVAARVSISTPAPHWSQITIESE